MVDKLPAKSKPVKEGIAGDHLDKQRNQATQKLNKLTKSKLIQELQKLQDNLTYGQQIAKTGSWTHDIKTDEMFLSQEIYRIFGCNPKQFDGALSSLYSFVHPDDLQVVRKATQDALYGKEYEIEYRIFSKDGSIKYVHERTKTLYDEKNEPAQMIGIVQDITSRKTAEIELKAIEEDLSQAQRVTSVGSGKFDVINQEFYCSSEFYRIFDIDPAIDYSSFINEVLYSIHPEDKNTVIAAFEKLLMGTPFQIEYRILLKSEEVRHVFGKGVPIFNENNQVASVLGTVQDVTENKKLEKKLEAANRVLAQAQALTQIGSWEINLSNNEMHCSDEVFKIYGIQPDQYNIKYEWFLKIVHPDDIPIIENLLKNPKEGKINLEFRMMKPDGSVRNILAMVEFLFDKEGEPTHIFGTIQDITEKKEMKKEIERKRQEIDRVSKRFHALIKESSDVFEILAPDGTIQYMSEASERVIGYKPEERVGRKVYEFYSGGDLMKARQMMKRIVDNPEEKVQEDLLFRAKDGSEKYLEVNMQNLMNEPSIEGIVINFRDITQRVLMERKMLYLSTHDDETGLPNRLYFHQELSMYLQSAREESSQLAVIMIDIDGFRHISDVLGYQLGDELIIRIYERLQPIFGAESLICRYSSSRLVVMLPNFYDKTELDSRVRKAMDLSKHTFKVDSYGLDIGIYIGIRIIQGAIYEPDTIVQQAEMALSLARNEGKNQYRYYSTGIDIRNYKQFELRNDLKRSIEKNQLEVHFQPIVQLQTNEIIAAEALIRWEHPYWGMVPPDEFISLAEETGFIINIGRWVLREVCRKYTEWLEKGLPGIKVSINFSSIQFFEDNFVESIISTIYEFGLDPGFLVMEITESTLLDNKEKAVLDIKRLKAFGIQIALDDFGTGFSSLAYLHSFDIDILKIDGSFIRNSIVDSASEVIIRSIINMALELNLRLVAEGIENEQQLIHLQKLNCYSGQGYLFSRPLPVDVFESILSQKVCIPAPQSAREPSKQKERRQSARINLAGLLEADLSILELNKTKVNIGNTKVLVKNISPGGLCFVTNVRMPVDRNAILQFAAQISGIKIQITGSAVWISSLGSGLYEYGVKFEFKENEKLEFVSILNQVQEEMKHEALISEDLPASGKNERYIKRVTEVIYNGKR